MLKLNLLQNAYHSLYHAVEHLALAENEMSSYNNATFDHDDHSIEWRTGDGHLSWWKGEVFTKPPCSYNYKFAILHLIQALELLIKGYIHTKDQQAVFDVKDKNKTISMSKALVKLMQLQPLLLTPGQVNIIDQAKKIRNILEHYEVSFSIEKIKRIALDFLNLSAFLSYKLFGVNLIDEFSYDPWTNDGDPVGEKLSRILSHNSPESVFSRQKIANLWQKRNLEDTLFLCLMCGSKGISLSKSKCVVCGNDEDLETGKILEELSVWLEKQYGKPPVT